MTYSLKERFVRRLTASHLAGPDLRDALHIRQEAAHRGWMCTLAYWSGPDDTPAAVVRTSMAALESLLADATGGYLSVKVPALGYDIGAITALLQRAEPSGVRIHFDAMDPESAERTFDILRKCAASHTNIGCTLPARWRRSLDDAEALAGMGIPIRIVKGQWQDPLHRRIDVRRQFLEIVRRLADSASIVAVATHDRPLARRSLTLLKESGRSCEMEQMSGLPQNCRHLAHELGVPFRIYIPFGYPSLPYDIRQVRARPAVIAWALRDAVAGKHRPLS